VTRTMVAAIDQGTTSTRCLIVGADGAVLGAHQLEHAQHYPRPGWVEHDALEIWERTQQVVEGALKAANARGAEIAAIGITNQRETTLVWDRRTGKPYHPAIVWQDTRTGALCRELMADAGQDRFRARTGLPIATYFSGPKLRWLLDNVEGLREDAEAGHALFGNIDTWLIWNLTGGVEGGSHVTDPTNASRTLLMDLGRRAWDDELLAAHRIPAGMMPSIRPSSDPGFYGQTRADGVFGHRIPVCADLGDQQAALFGQACFADGDAKNTYGTGCFLLLNTGTKIVASAHGLLTTVAYQIGDDAARYALEGSVAISGALIQWLRDNLGLIATAGEVEQLAASVEDNGGMYLVPAFSGLYAPHWRADARGVMVGLTRFIDKRHIARAALEATAYQSLEVLEAMRKDSGCRLSALRVDGGMVVNELLMQFQADMLSVPVIRPEIAETTSMGAAFAAGLAVGVWESESALSSMWREAKRWEPSMDSELRERLFAGWEKAVSRTLDWI